MSTAKNVDLAVALLCLELGAAYSQVQDSFVINCPEKNKAELFRRLGDILK